MKEKKKIPHNEGFKIIRAEKGAGLGLQTFLSYKKGDFVIEYTGKKCLNKDIEFHPGKYLFEIDDKYTIDGFDRSNLARYINHSCKPNCEVEIENGKINIYALKNINVGDELTYDYGKEYFDEFIKPIGCKCEKCINKKDNGKSRTRKKKK